MMEVSEHPQLLRFQQQQQFCDCVLVSSTGGRFHGHSGILCAVCPELSDILSDCDPGNYCIETGYSDEVLQALIAVAYTDKPIIDLSDEDNADLNHLTGGAHKNTSRNLCATLKSFYDKGLFCDTIVSTENGQLESMHSYVAGGLVTCEWPQKDGCCWSIVLPSTANVDQVINDWYEVALRSSVIQIDDDVDEKVNQHDLPVHSIVCDERDKKTDVHVSPTREECEPLNVTQQPGTSRKHCDVPDGTLTKSPVLSLSTLNKSPLSNRTSTPLIEKSVSILCEEFEKGEAQNQTPLSLSSSLTAASSSYEDNALIIDEDRDQENSEKENATIVSDSQSKLSETELINDSSIKTKQSVDCDGLKNADIMESVGVSNTDIVESVAVSNTDNNEVSASSTSTDQSKDFITSTGQSHTTDDDNNNGRRERHRGRRRNKKYCPSHDWKLVSNKHSVPDSCDAAGDENSAANANKSVFCKVTNEAGVVTHIVRNGVANSNDNQTRRSDSSKKLKQSANCDDSVTDTHNNQVLASSTVTDQSKDPITSSGHSHASNDDNNNGPRKRQRGKRKQRKKRKWLYSDDGNAVSRQNKRSVIHHVDRCDTVANENSAVNDQSKDPINSTGQSHATNDDNKKGCSERHRGELRNKEYFPSHDWKLVSPSNKHSMSDPCDAARDENSAANVNKSLFSEVTNEAGVKNNSVQNDVVGNNDDQTKLSDGSQKLKQSANCAESDTRIVELVTDTDTKCEVTASSANTEQSNDPIASSDQPQAINDNGDKERHRGRNKKRKRKDVFSKSDSHQSKRAVVDYSDLAVDANSSAIVNESSKADRRRSSDSIDSPYLCFHCERTASSPQRLEAHLRHKHMYSSSEAARTASRVSRRWYENRYNKKRHSVDNEKSSGWNHSSSVVDSNQQTISETTPGCSQSSSIVDKNQRAASEQSSSYNQHSSSTKDCNQKTVSESSPAWSEHFSASKDQKTASELNPAWSQYSTSSEYRPESFGTRNDVPWGGQNYYVKNPYNTPPYVSQQQVTLPPHAVTDTLSHTTQQVTQSVHNGTNTLPHVTQHTHQQQITRSPSKMPDFCSPTKSDVEGNTVTNFRLPDKMHQLLKDVIKSNSPVKDGDAGKKCEEVRDKCDRPDVLDMKGLSGWEQGAINAFLAGSNWQPPDSAFSQFKATLGAFQGISSNYGAAMMSYQRTHESWMRAEGRAFEAEKERQVFHKEKEDLIKNVSALKKHCHEQDSSMLQLETRAFKAELKITSLTQENAELAERSKQSHILELEEQLASCKTDKASLQERLAYFDRTVSADKQQIQMLLKEVDRLKTLLPDNVSLNPCDGSTVCVSPTSTSGTAE